ncbi:MAG: NAD(P)/FAD-dependent oxidoreductase, partial [Nitrospirales bacterium]|nr:NAD(P)/FAD-dependent oxidoreductase [Nitrospirales bacterium]
MKSYDHIIVGSGINSLVCAAILAQKGRSVLVLERNDRLGGCIRTEEITLPHFIHDVFSGFHPLFVSSPGYSELADDLRANGLQYVNTDTPTGAVLPDGRCLIMNTSRKKNIAAMNSIAKGDGDRYATAMDKFEKSLDLINVVLGNELWQTSTFKLLLGTAWKMGLTNVANFAGSWRQSCQQWLNQDFRSDEVKALLAPWVLHAGLDPKSPMSGPMAMLIASMLEA